MWFLFVTMLFNGGLIPTYFVVLKMGMINRFWSLLIPLLPTQVFNIILLLNFFRRVPVELEEAAFIDGAGHLQILWRVYLPVSHCGDRHHLPVRAGVPLERVVLRADLPARSAARSRSPPTCAPS